MSCSRVFKEASDSNAHSHFPVAALRHIHVDKRLSKRKKTLLHSKLKLMLKTKRPLRMRTRQK